MGMCSISAIHYRHNPRQFQNLHPRPAYGCKIRRKRQRGGHCTATIEKAIKETDPTAEVPTDRENKTVSVESSLDSAVLQSTLEKAGYPAKLV